MANRLTIKGQVTIPKEIRDFLNLASGNQVEFRREYIEKHAHDARFLDA